MRSYYSETTVQNFIPRNFGFSIGIDCDEKNNNHNLNQGLTFNIRLYDATNDTECILDGKWISGRKNYYVHTTFPNLFGNQYSQGSYKDYNQFDRLLRMVDPDYTQSSCYQHLHEIATLRKNRCCLPVERLVWIYLKHVFIIFFPFCLSWELYQVKSCQEYLKMNS